MTDKQLRKHLQTCNLSALARLSGMDVRSIRRVRNGTAPIRPSTVERLSPHISAAKQ